MNNASNKLAGCVNIGGKVACNCQECKGNIVTLLEWEEHSGSWDRYRTNNMILSKYDISLKVHVDTELNTTLALP